MGEKEKLKLESNNDQSNGNECYGKRGHSFGNDFEFLRLEEGASSGGSLGGRGEGGGGGGGSGLFCSFLRKASLSSITKLMVGTWRLSVGTWKSACLMRKTLGGLGRRVLWLVDGEGCGKGVSGWRVMGG